MRGLIELRVARKEGQKLVRDEGAVSSWGLGEEFVDDGGGGVFDEC
jgi:hypothetical protein